jgi:hypothetical protein
VSKCKNDKIKILKGYLNVRLAWNQWMLFSLSNSGGNCMVYLYLPPIK